MKVRVNRALISGQYRVAFAVDQFTAEEAEKMDKFGVPKIVMKMVISGQMTNRQVGINQITESLMAVFGNEKDAIEYQDNVLAALKTAIEEVRQRKDSFTALVEVEF